MDAEKQRFSLTLKPSLVASSDASLLHSLFADLEFAAQLRWGPPCAAARLPSMYCWPPVGGCHLSASASHQGPACT